MAVEAAAVMGLDIAGIDYLTPDVSRSYRDVGGAICEVNCSPGAFVHALAGGDGLSKIAVAYVDYMFPEGATGRVSTIAMLGGGSGTMCAYMMADVLKQSGRTIGIASADGLFVDGKCTRKGDMSRAVAARALLRHQRIDTAIFDLTPDGVVEEGLAFDRAMVSVIRGPHGDGTDSFNKAEDKSAMAARRLVIDVAENAIVLCADDPLCATVLDAGGRNVYLVADREENAALQKYKSAGHAVVTTAVRSGEATIVVRADGDVEPAIEVSRIPPAAGVSALAWIEAAMYAVALGHAFGISPAAIGDRLAGFKLPAGPKFQSRR
jgi:cyanophycin synthetase